MKPVFYAIIALLLSPLFITAGIRATDLTPEQLSQWNQFVESIKGTQGIGQMGFTVIVVQALMFFIRKNFPGMSGKTKIMVLQFITVVFGMLTLHAGEFDLASAFTHSNVLAAIQVFLHQLYKQFTETEEKYSLPAVK